MRRPALQRAFGRSRLMRRLSIGLLARFELMILSGHKEPGLVSRLHEARARGESLLTGNEAFLLHALARAQRRLGGAYAEVGVYQGSSAEIMCLGKGDTELHLFDTFGGLPAPRDGEDEVLHRGQFAAGLEGVRARLAAFEGVEFHPGLFPDTAEDLGDTRFSLVHLDVDLYASTLDALRYFYPRMLPGGIIVSHDFSILPGVAEAFATFLADKEEEAIELPTTQAMIVRREAPATREAIAENNL